MPKEAPGSAREPTAGDLYPSQVRELVGDHSLPSCLLGASPDEVWAVDRALEAYYEKR